MGVDVDVRGDILPGVAKRIAELKGEVTIGLHADAAPYPDGTDVVMVGAFHEFNKRPWMRAWYDSGGQKALSAAAVKGVGMAVDGTENAAAVNERIGETGVDGLRDFVESGQVTPPLEQATLANPNRDRRGIPLLDTGHMIGQVDWKAGE